MQIKGSLEEVNEGVVTINSFLVASQYPAIGIAVAGTLAHNTMGTANCTIMPIDLAGNLPIGQIQIRTNLAAANNFELSIFDSVGTRVYHSGTLSTVAAGWVIVNPTTFTLPAGRYYVGFTNKGGGTTAAYTVGPALGTGIPRWGTVANASAGNAPLTINPGAITEVTTAIFPVWIRFSTANT